MAFEYSDTSHKYISDSPCPHCNKQSTYKLISRANDLIQENTLVYDDTKFSFPYHINFQGYQCEYCNKLRFIITRAKIYSEGSTSEDTILEFPLPGFQDIDREKIKHQLILENLDEGMRCLVSNSPKGAIVNFRRAMQAAVIILGGKGIDLQTQINNLYEKEIIRAKTRDIAHKVRAFGNLGAHPFELTLGEGGLIKEDDFSKLILEDAIQAIKMLILFLDDAFIYPSKLDNIDKRINELKNKQ